MRTWRDIYGLPSVAVFFLQNPALNYQFNLDNFGKRKSGSIIYYSLGCTHWGDGRQENQGALIKDEQTVISWPAVHFHWPCAFVKT